MHDVGGIQGDSERLLLKFIRTHGNEPCAHGKELGALDPDTGELVGRRPMLKAQCPDCRAEGLAILAQEDEIVALRNQVETLVEEQNATSELAKSLEFNLRRLEVVVARMQNTRPSAGGDTRYQSAEAAADRRWHGSQMRGAR